MKIKNKKHLFLSSFFFILKSYQLSINDSFVLEMKLIKIDLQLCFKTNYDIANSQYPCNRKIFKYKAFHT